MIVVSNTSPLTNLAAIQRFDLLSHLYSRICIPEGVWHELNAFDKTWPGRDEVANAAWIERRTVMNQPLLIALSRDLDQGEAETIALAVELRADLVLIDEKDGRRLAHRHNLKVVGVLGILLEAKQRRLIDSVLPNVDLLRQVAGFYVTDQVYQAVGRLAHEIV